MEEKMRIRARVGILGVVASLWAASAAPGLAADTGAVSAQVTVAAPCITVSATTVDFGARSFAVLASKDLTYTNCGPVDEKIYGKATNASGTSGTWTLDPAFRGEQTCGSGAPTNKYAVISQVGVSSDYTFLSTADQLLETATAGSA